MKGKEWLASGFEEDQLYITTLSSRETAEFLAYPLDKAGLYDDIPRLLRFCRI